MWGRLSSVGFGQIAGRRETSFGEYEMRNFLKVLLVLFVIAPAPAMAGFDEGRAAFIKGDWQTVKAEMLPLAEAGDAKAQIAMGLLYARGQAVVQDWAKAVYWFSAAVQAAKGLEDRIERTVVRILASENLAYSSRQPIQVAALPQ
jgi:hypothetical protein